MSSRSWNGLVDEMESKLRDAFVEMTRDSIEEMFKVEFKEIDWHILS